LLSHQHCRLDRVHFHRAHDGRTRSSPRMESGATTPRHREGAAPVRPVSFDRQASGAYKCKDGTVTWTTQRHRRTPAFRCSLLRRLQSTSVQRQLHGTAGLLPRWSAMLLQHRVQQNLIQLAAGPCCLLCLQPRLPGGMSASAFTDNAPAHHLPSESPSCSDCPCCPSPTPRFPLRGAPRARLPLDRAPAGGVSCSQRGRQGRAPRPRDSRWGSRVAQGLQASPLRMRVHWRAVLRADAA
jgi:hypothetical protein